jgi:hypothetical protein
MKKIYTITIITVFIICTISAILYYINNQKSAFTAQQNANKILFDKAIKTHNPELCKKLSGDTPYQSYGPADEDLGLQLISESTAKKYCIDNAHTGRYYGP